MLYFSAQGKTNSSLGTVQLEKELCCINMGLGDFYVLVSKAAHGFIRFTTDFCTKHQYFYLLSNHYLMAFESV